MSEQLDRAEAILSMDYQHGMIREVLVLIVSHLRDLEKKGAKKKKDKNA